MSLLLGGQPKTMQRNFNSRNCGLCVTWALENAQHVLFECTANEDTRGREWRKLLNALPPAMAAQYAQYSHEERLKCILAGPAGPVINEWKDVYGAMSEFVYKMYKSRAQQYDRASNT